MKSVFDTLPPEEQRLIRAAANAVSAETLGKAEARAFVKESNRWDGSLANTRRASDNPPISEQLAHLLVEDGRSQWAEHWQAYGRQEYVRAFRHLATTKKIADDDQQWLIETVEKTTNFVLVAVFTDGRATVTLQPKFSNPDGMIAYALLRLSEISARIVVCDECGRVDIPEPRVGAPTTRFCSSKCRNRFNQRKLRTSKRQPRNGKRKNSTRRPRAASRK